MISELESPKGSSLVLKAISSHLIELGYPERSLNSMLRCGKTTGFYAFRECSCNVKSIPLTYRCNLRTCPTCSKIRKKRIFSRFFPFFKLYQVTKSDFFQFLTISPPNYNSLEEGFDHLRKSFSKFVRRKYIHDRIKAGFYVLETKQSDDGKWNIHLHAVIYGRWLDYRIRGQCLDCGQNLLKFNKISKKFYCANRKCNSLNIVRKTDTRLGREWFESSGDVAHIYGERVKSVHGAVCYLIKYIAVDKSSFLTHKSIAEYIYHSRKRKLINAFGLFYKEKIKMSKSKYFCPDCKGEISFFFDVEVSYILREIENRPPPDIPIQKNLCMCDGWESP